MRLRPKVDDPKPTSPGFILLLVLSQFPVTAWAVLPFLNKMFFHHLDQFRIFQDLLDNVGMGSPVKLAAREATFSAHFSAP